VTAKKKAADTEVVDLDPIELYPPDPALTRWMEIAFRDDEIIHDGDASKVLPFPRPAWADPDEDLVSGCPLLSLYRAIPVRVPVSRHRGDDRNGIMTTPAAYVQPVINGDKRASIRLSLSLYENGKWDNDKYLAFRIAEARDLIGALQAAVDLIGGDE
jgi:hypothetical protein